MARRSPPRNPLFDGRWFEDEIIILCLRRYFRYRLSYRDLVEMMGERGLPVAYTTILRRAVRYAEEFEKRWRRYERPVGGSWRADETYLKVRGHWVYLFRAVDTKGKTVDFYLSRTRDQNAATASFRKGMEHHGEPRTITLDGFDPSPSALRCMGMRNEFNYRWENPVKIRSCQYLNNIVEQDHRRVKFRLQPMLGFQRFYNARRVITGVELAQKIHKDSSQYQPGASWCSGGAAEGADHRVRDWPDRRALPAAGHLSTAAGRSLAARGAINFC